MFFRNYAMKKHEKHVESLNLFFSLCVLWALASHRLFKLKSRGKKRKLKWDNAFANGCFKSASGPWWNTAGGWNESIRWENEQLKEKLQDVGTIKGFCVVPPPHLQRTNHLSQPATGLQKLNVLIHFDISNNILVFENPKTKKSCEILRNSKPCRCFIVFSRQAAWIESSFERAQQKEKQQQKASTDYRSITAELFSSASTSASSDV